MSDVSIQRVLPHLDAVVRVGVGVAVFATALSIVFAAKGDALLAASIIRESAFTPLVVSMLLTAVPALTILGMVNSVTIFVDLKKSNALTVTLANYLILLFLITSTVVFSFTGFVYLLLTLAAVAAYAALRPKCSAILSRILRTSDETMVAGPASRPTYGGLQNAGIAAFALVIFQLASGSNSLPFQREQIDGPSKTVVGSVLSVSSEWTVVLQDQPRQLIYVPTPSVASRVVCRLPSERRSSTPLCGTH